MRKSVTILPADSYIVLNKTILSENDRKLISKLYQPIIGYTAVSLYSTLLDDLDENKIMSSELTHHHLMTTMQLKLDHIIEARKRLEACGLLKTYMKQQRHINEYVYLIYSPLSPQEFFSHPILNIVLYNNLGKKEYEKIVNFYKTPHYNLKDYTDITAEFSTVFKTSSITELEKVEDIAERTSNNLTLREQIDFNLLISSLPKNMISERCFTSDVKELINALSFIYQIDDLAMQGLVRNALNEKGLIDRVELRKSCRNYYQFEQGGRLPTLVYSKQPEYLKKEVGDTSKWAKMVYTFENISPYDYLKSKYKGAEPTTRDLRLIESLLIDQQLKPGVINVLLSYVLKINNQKLNKNYIETIVGQWKRLNIETVEEAMKITEKEHKKMKKMMESKKKTIPKQKKEEHLPAWFNKELEKEETTDEDAKELEKILDSLA